MYIPGVTVKQFRAKKAGDRVELDHRDQPCNSTYLPTGHWTPDAGEDCARTACLAHPVLFDVGAQQIESSSLERISKLEARSPSSFEVLDSATAGIGLADSESGILTSRMVSNHSPWSATGPSAVLPSELSFTSDNFKFLLAGDTNLSIYYRARCPYVASSGIHEDPTLSLGIHENPIHDDQDLEL
ncbi:hypothetical protein B0H16DRAFT_1780642 [Mycena metata]|uniref:Uncharacterized protein n=1 Tax=Mycena metata TaxID=1033252 RepID=A0AAD7MQA2_9AGAR|nr:hypothetical protein B0H16DRAFT_1780642 [Mycena metata]